jgi:hypothetical protein
MAAKKKTQVAAPSQADPRASLDAAAFLSAAQRVLAVLRDDLLTRADASPGVTEALKAQWEAEKEAKRTGDPWELWRRRVVVQVAAAWVLSLVFARTLEDRGLLERNRIAGPGATDSQEQFRAIAPYLSDRDYLLTVFQELSNLPAAKDLFDPAHNPVWKLGPSIDGARALLDLFRAPDPEAPAFRFGQSDTRFLGDLYQSLDEETQERFALLQTPHFVEAYILERTLERAIARFGLDDTAIIDPTCGSGHFLLGAFARLVDHRLRKEPALDAREAARRALDAVYGADINPYAVSIARFRLTLAFLERSGYARLADAPALPVHLVVGDSLLHAPLQAHLGDVAATSKEAWAGSEFALQDEAAAKDVLLRRYAAVIGNPPYITVKDPVLRQRYREMYPRSAAREYSLGAPFTERFFLLARASGFVGMITANSFMKREFGKKLIEEFLPTVNLDGVVNTSGAYIPGHGTPTVLLFGTNEPKQGRDVQTVLAKRGEPSTPDDPARGLVWSSVANHGEDIGFENDYISVGRVSRTTLEKHPWSLGGGGAAELKELLESRAVARLDDVVELIGFGAVTREDELFQIPLASGDRFGITPHSVMAYGFGEAIRDWAFEYASNVVFPYDRNGTVPARDLGRWMESAWCLRTQLWARQGKGFKTKRESGGLFFEYSMFYPERHFTDLKIAFAFVATHNHFVLDRGGKVFNRSAPIIKLKEGATEDDHLALLAYLNSSTACFWMKQVMMNKGGSGIGRGVQDEAWEARFEFDGTKMATVPMPADWQSLAPLAREMIALAGARANESPAQLVSRARAERVTLVDELIGRAKDSEINTLHKMIAVQERIDFEVYRLFGLLESELPSPAAITPGMRPFEVQMVRDDAPTAWFARHGYDRPDAKETAVDDLGLPAEVRLIEQPTFKRRWVLTDWSDSVEAARRTQLLGLCESYLRQHEPLEVLTARSIMRDVERGASGGDFIMPPGGETALAKWIAEDSVSFLASYRHTVAGLEKRAQWERVWSLQRAEDRGETVLPFDPAPKYDQKDYRDANMWRLRGKLDVPKERFVSYPGCESDEDKEPVYGWAGWNHLQQAIALATLYLKRKQGEAWGKDRLVPMLAGLDELLPWIWQWHPDPTPESGGVKPGQYIADFLSAQCQELGVTLDEVRAWRPESKKNGVGASTKMRTSKKNKAAAKEETP